MADTRKEHGWTLVPYDDIPGVDSAESIITSPYPPTNASETTSDAVFTTQNIPGRRPSVQFSHLTDEKFSFKATFIGDPTGTEDMGDEATRRQAVLVFRNKLKATTQVVESLRRPAKYVFTWGSISFVCFVTSVGAIEYTGTQRWNGIVIQHVATFSISLMVDSGILTESIWARAQEPSKHHPTEGETYEKLAGRLYGDPMLGVPMRQLNESAAAKGIALKMVDEQLLRRIGFAPQSVAMQLVRGDVSSAVNTIATTRITLTPPGQGAYNVVREKLG